MASTLARFAFIDSVHAAEVLHLTQEQVLDLVRQGKLKTYGGKPTNPFLRSADVAALVADLGISADGETKRTKGPVARVQPRLTSDARWSDVSEEDIAEWVKRADRARRVAARTAAQTALTRLQIVLAALDEAEGRGGDTP